MATKFKLLVKSFWWLIPVACLVIPYFAFQHMKERKALEGVAPTQTINGDGYQIKCSTQADVIIYGDGTSKPIDGYGHVVMPWAVYQADTSVLGGIPNLTAEKFPVIVFFNSTGFDPASAVAAVRSLRDGTLLYEDPDRAKSLVASLTVLADLQYRVTYRDGSTETVSEDVWQRKFLHTEPPVKVPSSEELDKMTDAQLEALGMSRLKMSRGEYERLFGKLPDKTPDKSQAKEPAAGSQGIALTIRPAGKPNEFAAVRVLVLHDSGITPGPIADSDPRIVSRLTSDRTGVTRVTLAPGVYTLVTVSDGTFYAPRTPAGLWSSVAVGDAGWTPYTITLGSK